MVARLLVLARKAITMARSKNSPSGPTNGRKPRRKAKAKAKAKAPTHRPLVARDLLDASHPLHGPFAAWCKAREAKQTAGGHLVGGGAYGGSQADPSALSARKARKFLRDYPQYRKVLVEIKPAA